MNRLAVPDPVLHARAFGPPAIDVRGLRKEFTRGGRRRGRRNVAALADVTLEIPREARAVRHLVNRASAKRHVKLRRSG